MICRFISDQENKKKDNIISVLDAMHLAAFAWKNVASQTIKNCFRKCVFSQKQTASSTNKFNFKSVWANPGYRRGIQYHFF